MTESSPAAAGTPASAGALLRQARQAQGLHIAALAAALKVNQRKLELLENDEFGQLPDIAFARALAQAVCRHLKIEAAPVLALLPAAIQVQPALERVTQGLQTPFREAAQGQETREPPGWLQARYIVPAVLVLAAVGFLLVPNRWLDGVKTGLRGSAPASGPGAAEAGADPQPSAAPQTSTELLNPVIEAIGAGASAPVTAAPANAAAPVPAPLTAPPPSTPPAPTPATAPTPAPAPPAVAVPAPAAPPATAAASAAAPASAPVAPLPAGMLAFRATASSWVEVADGFGNLLFARELRAGEAVGLNGELPLRVKVGRADAVQMQFRGRPVTFKASGDRSAQVTLN